MRFPSRTSTVPSSVCGKARDHAIVTSDWVPVSLFGRAAKQAFDIVAATVGLILLSPTFLLVAIAIKIDSRGAVFRSQTAYGYSNENIRVLKFRTILGHGKVTRVGAVLCRTGIDGLPLLINVLRGEMSIVGPSSYVPVRLLSEQVSLIQQRKRVRPGITGWAQVNGCCGEGDKMMRQRIEFDQYYIENWSFLFDMRIILITLFSNDTHLN
jgi:lipopolysaccharide/colanic/teichoic acid biosynthesis glycosyltransferase